MRTTTSRFPNPPAASASRTPSRAASLACRSAAAADAAYALGDTYASEDPSAAVEYYLTAAYVAPDSAQGRRGLLGAARAYAAARQPELASTAYKKLLAQSDLPADVRDAARKELAALPRSAQ